VGRSPVSLALAIDTTPQLPERPQLTASGDLDDEHEGAVDMPGDVIERR